jgi:phosphatidylglycerophosphate synthase
MTNSAQYPSLPWDNCVVKQIRTAVQKTKVQEEFWAYYVLRRISIYLSILFSELPVFDSPNFVTVLGIISMLLATGFAITGSKIGLIFACLLYQLGYLFDCIDGEVARLTNRCSRIGKILDTILDGVNVLLLGGFAYGIARSEPGSITLNWFLFISFVGLISFTTPRIITFLNHHNKTPSRTDAQITTKLRHSNMIFDLPAFIFSPPGLYTVIFLALIFPLGTVIPIILKIYAAGLLAKTILRILLEARIWSPAVKHQEYESYR